MDKSSINKIYNLIILDESGSMESIKQPTINGFNELLQSIKGSARESPEIAQWVNFYSFNGRGIKEQMKLNPVAELSGLTSGTYRPDEMTPLYDAIGIACNNLQQAIATEKDFSVLVTILTDGEENASKEYTQTAVNALITALKSKGWVFTYIGANHDVAKASFSLNISNHLTFTATVEETNVMFAKNKKSRDNYMDKVKRNEKDNLQDDFFKDVNPGDN